MNYAPTFGWFYNSLNDRAPAWTSVEYFFNFLIKNKGVGPYGKECRKSELELGDIIQMQIGEEDFQHTTIISGISENDFFVCAHTYDAKNRPISSYMYKKIRYIHILGARKWG